MTQAGLPCCLLCGAPVADDADYSAHLARVHDLVDDEGTSSRVPDTDAWIVMTESAPAIDLSPRRRAPRVYDSSQDDERLRPVVLGFGGLMVLLVIVGWYVALV